MMKMPKAVKYGIIWKLFDMSKKKVEQYKKESIRAEINRLIDSLDFEKPDFKDVIHKIRRLMCMIA